MLLRLLVYALLTPMLFTGCTAQRDTPEVVTETEGGNMGPNGPVYIFGAWDFTATQIDGDDTLTGTLTIGEERDASRIALSDGSDSPLVIDELDVTNANFILKGAVQTDNGPLSLSLAGSINGDEMSAEAEVEGLGTYALTGMRQRE